MAFKLIQDGERDFPVLMCDVCGNRIFDIFGDLASGHDGGPVVIHHKACPTTETLHVSIRQFFIMVMMRNRVGDLASDGVTEKITIEMPIEEGFGI
jgi:hypothetical protein